MNDIFISGFRTECIDYALIAFSTLDTHSSSLRNKFICIVIILQYHEQPYQRPSDASS